MTDDARLSATDEKRLATLREALDVDIYELDAGLSVEATPEQLMADVLFEVELGE